MAIKYFNLKKMQISGILSLLRGCLFKKKGFGDPEIMALQRSWHCSVYALFFL